MSKKQPHEGFYYCILPSGNTEEFPWLDAELKAREVKSWYTNAGHGRMYRIAGEDLGKLPYDRPTRERYLGDDDSGHHIYPLLNVKKYLELQNAKEEWVIIYGPPTIHTA